jgi:hypothetical protein
VNQTHSLTHSLMELSPSWEAANCAATRELPSILLNPEVYHSVHISPPPVPILNQIDPIPTIPSYLSKIHFKIVHPSTSWSSQWSLSFYNRTNALKFFCNSYISCISFYRLFQPADTVLLLHIEHWEESFEGFPMSKDRFMLSPDPILPLKSSNVTCSVALLCNLPSTEGYLEEEVC